MINRFFYPVLLLILACFVFRAAPAGAQGRELPQSKTQIQLSFAPLVKMTAPAVVNIYTKRTVSKSIRNPFMGDPFFAPFFRQDLFRGQMRQQIESALGSGTIVDPAGLVVTNAHVVRDAEEITVVLADGREFDATLALRDDASDLALLRVEPGVEKLPFVRLTPSETLEVGDLVLAIGNPFGMGQTVTSGIISAQGRSSLDINDYSFFIQTDAAINPGNSGGPLVALDGGVVGINTAIYSRSGGSLGIGFAIPSEMVASVIAAEKAGLSGASGITRPWLGVSAQNITPDIGDSLGLKSPHGALITTLHEASPFKKAGIRVGDVITSIEGRVIRDAAEMKFRMAMVPLGKTAKVEILRQKKPETLEVKAIMPPDDPPRNQKLLGGNHLLSGATIANLNPAVATQLGIEDSQEGVVVLDIERNAPAVALVSVGSRLLEINGQTVNTVGDVEKALKASAGRGIALVTETAGRIRKIILR
ncbi:MAG: Do family serine endopeptidase [Alphaproteobacteria bacterium]|nr:Do family serine endopeptidase [Alphaproteobacteria bacterium]